MNNKLRNLGITLFSLSFVALSLPNAFAGEVAVSAASFRSIAESDLLVLGPVESANPKNLEIRVLGQTAVVPSSQREIVSAELVGRMVAIYGTLNADGSLKLASVSELGSIEYVPGATELYVKGVVRAVNHANAIVSLGALSVRYEGALHSLNADNVVAGGVVAISGLQFTNTATLYADNGIAYGVNSLGQAGSDKLVSAAGQAGSDKLVSAAGQAGSDKLVSAAGQAGSDKLVSTAGQAGSDKLVSTAGQAGSDKLVSAAGQAGSDKLVSTAGQAGSDKLVSAAGQAGSDKLVSTAGQAGSDSVGQTGGQ